VKGFELIKKRVMASLMDVESIEEDLYDIMKVPIEEGGLGLGNMEIVSNSAYLASFYDSMVQEQGGESYEEIPQGRERQILDYLFGVNLMACWPKFEKNGEGWEDMVNRFWYRLGHSQTYFNGHSDEAYEIVGEFNGIKMDRLLRRSCHLLLNRVGCFIL